MNVLIMAGGSGTRLWPVSRRDRPKQFCVQFDFEPLFVHTLRRAETLREGDDRILVIAGEDHLPWVTEQGRGAAAVIGEPVGRNTAPCIGLAALWFAAKNPDAVMAVLPADHLVADTERFSQDLRLAADVATETAALVTFGIEPATPHTGFGYIQAGATVPGGDGRVRSVTGFTEKPDQERAREYLAAGHYFWNTGIFVWRAADVLALIDEYLPALGQTLQRVGPEVGGDREAEAVRRFYLDLPPEAATSIDYGVLEPAAAAGRVLMIPAAFDWDDVGGWPALGEHWPLDDKENAAGTPPRPIVHDASGNLVYADHKLVALLGVHDLVVVATGDVVLVCPKERAEEVGKLVERLQTDPDLKRYL
jgi:mannose-1-phosphate guanylyltransferase